MALDVEQAYALTEKIMVENAKAPDAIEGMKAFLERVAEVGRCLAALV